MRASEAPLAGLCSPGAVGALTVGAGAGWLVEEDVLTGRTRAYEIPGLNGDGAPIPDVEPGPRVDGAFTSAARGDVEVGWSVSYPPGRRPGSRLPVVLMLHQRLLLLRAVGALSPALREGDGVLDHPSCSPASRCASTAGPLVHDFVESLDPEPLHSFGAGGHTASYWRTVVPDQLRFLADHLT